MDEMFKNYCVIDLKKRILEFQEIYHKGSDKSIKDRFTIKSFPHWLRYGIFENDEEVFSLGLCDLWLLNSSMGKEFFKLSSKNKDIWTHICDGDIDDRIEDIVNSLISYSFESG
jgi:hypothetical protein